jgi:hypothetical protein
MERVETREIVISHSLVNHVSRNLISYKLRLSACSGNLCVVSKPTTYSIDSEGRTDSFGKEQHKRQPVVLMESRSVNSKRVGSNSAYRYWRTIWNATYCDLEILYN